MTDSIDYILDNRIILPGHVFPPSPLTVELHGQLLPTDVLLVFCGSTSTNCILSLHLWWHISATRYEIAIMINLEKYRDKTNFPGNII